MSLGKVAFTRGRSARRFLACPSDRLLISELMLIIPALLLVCVVSLSAAEIPARNRPASAAVDVGEASPARGAEKPAMPDGLRIAPRSLQA